MQIVTVLFLLFLKYLFIYLAVLGVSCGTWDPALWAGIKPRPPALRAWSLSHWTTREVPVSFFSIYMPFISSSCLTIS